jgi:hypothetical protein
MGDRAPRQRRDHAGRRRCDHDVNPIGRPQRRLRDWRGRSATMTLRPTRPADASPHSRLRHSLFGQTMPLKPSANGAEIALARCAGRRTRYHTDTTGSAAHARAGAIAGRSQLPTAQDGSRDEPADDHRISRRCRPWARGPRGSV